MKILSEAFKKSFSAQNRNLDQRTVSDYMQRSLYNSHALSYPAFSADMHDKETYTRVKAVNAQAQILCGRMQRLGLSNFSELRRMFQSIPKTDSELQQKNLIKQTMEDIFYQVEKAEGSAKSTILNKYKDYQFDTISSLRSMLADPLFGNHGIDGYIAQQKEEFVRGVATNVYERSNELHKNTDKYTYKISDNIHYINALVDGVASEYRIKISNASYHINMSGYTIRELSTKLESELQKPEVVNRLVTDVARKVMFGLPLYTENDHNNPDHFRRQISNSLKNLKLDHIITAQDLIEFQNGSLNYKPNIQSIIKNATTLYMSERGALAMPRKELELTKLRIDLEKSTYSATANLGITKEFLDKAKEKENLGYALQYMVDNRLKLDNECGTTDPKEYMVTHKITDGVKREDAKKAVISKYLTANEEKRAELATYYQELDKARFSPKQSQEQLGLDLASNFVNLLPYSTRDSKHHQEFKAVIAAKIKDWKLEKIINENALIKQNPAHYTSRYKSNISSILKDATTLQLHNIGALKIENKELELTKLRIDLEKSIDTAGNQIVTQDILKAAKKEGNLDYAFKYMVDKQFKLNEDHIKYAIDNDIKISGIDQKNVFKVVIDEYTKEEKATIQKLKLELYYKELLEKLKADKLPDIDEKFIKKNALEDIVKEYLESNDPKQQKKLKNQYAEIQKLGDEQIPLTMESELGKFLNNPKTPKILANHQNFQDIRDGEKGIVLRGNIDYTKCDLDVVKKCIEVYEKMSKVKPRNYDSLSTVQKVGVAFATVVPVIGNMITYYAMKAYNKSEKTKLESQLEQSLDNIAGNLTSITQNERTRQKADIVTQLAKTKRERLTNQAARQGNVASCHRSHTRSKAQSRFSGRGY